MSYQDVIRMSMQSYAEDEQLRLVLEQSKQAFAEDEQLRMVLEQSRIVYRDVDVVGDGNCFPRAISVLLYGNESYHEFVREEAVSYIRRSGLMHSEEFSLHIMCAEWLSAVDSGARVEEYLSMMSRSMVDCDIMMVMAVSMRFNVRLTVENRASRNGTQTFNESAKRDVRVAYLPAFGGGAGHYKAMVVDN